MDKKKVEEIKEGRKQKMETKYCGNFQWKRGSVIVLYGVLDLTGSVEVKREYSLNTFYKKVNYINTEGKKEGRKEGKIGGKVTE